MIYFLQSIKTWHSNYGKQVELLFSREENSPCSWTRTRSSQRHSGGGRLYICTTAINFAPLNSPWKYVFHASFKPLSSINNLHIRQSLVRQKSSLTGIKAPTTTPLGSGVPTSLSTTCQRLWRRGVGLPQLLHTLPLVLGPKEEWTRGEWNPGWGELMPIDMSKDLLLSGQCRKWKIFFLCSKRDRCRWRIVFLQSWPTTNSTQF